MPEGGGVTHRAAQWQWTKGKFRPNTRKINCWEFSGLETNPQGGTVCPPSPHTRPHCLGLSHLLCCLRSITPSWSENQERDNSAVFKVCVWECIFKNQAHKGIIAAPLNELAPHGVITSSWPWGCVVSKGSWAGPGRRTKVEVVLTGGLWKGQVRHEARV